MIRTNVFATPLVLLLLVCTQFSDVQAQRLSVTANVSEFTLDQLDSEVASIDYQGSTSMSVNLRYFTKNNWAFRVGAGLDNLNYEVGGGIRTDYKAQRKDLKGIFGVEKHFPILGGKVDIYPGAFVPLTIAGEDVIDANLNNIKNGDTRAGLGLVLGANLKLMKIFRVGVEFDATYDNFKNQVWESAEQLSFVPLKGINTQTTFTVGVAF